MKKSKIFQWVIVFLILLFYVGIAIFQYSFPDKTGVIYLGLGIVLFILSTMIGYKLDDIRTEETFTKYLKDKAYGAIRRISDLEKFTTRGLNTLNKASTTTNNGLLVIENMKVTLLDIQDTLVSAKIDWTDVLGEELRKIVDIENKEKEFIELSLENPNKDSSKEDILEKLGFEIKELRKSLPIELNKIGTTQLLPLELQHNKMIELLNNELYARENVVVGVKVINPILLNLITENHPIFFYLDDPMGKQLVLYESAISSNIIGVVQNKFKELNIDDVVFNEAVFEMLLRGDFSNTKRRISVVNIVLTSRLTQTTEIIFIEIPKTNLSGLAWG